MDSANASPSNSKVIIQCTDPSNLFESLEPRLSARSPLKNLHWKSPNRPLRSISNLNILVNREQTTNGSHSNVRRHQIPGLRETPYVKLFLLRCDDKETYKESARKEIRQWVKANTPSGENKAAIRSQENHDAFEWLIVHVVMPNTPAASQPRSSKHITLETADSTDSVNSKSKWSGKSSSTIFDKLRADFSSSSKLSLSRVTQVRLLEPADKSTALTPAELEDEWLDLVECLKACILRSFDARVAQYELDIRERDSQRTLPGWNFCTFFVLKEGLARGFENVGLLEDALAVYDELSLGLDSLVSEESGIADHEDSGALLRFSKESKNLLRAALNPENVSSSSQDLQDYKELSHLLAAERMNFPFDVDRKRYRDLILSNEVSALDLRVYLFTRQTEILLRHARADATDVQFLPKTSCDLSLVADVAERAAQFINLAGRSLRLELYAAWGGQEGLSEDELYSQQSVTGNIVSSWMWCATLQVIAKIIPSLGSELVSLGEPFSIDSVNLAQDVEPTHMTSATTSAEMEKHLHRLSLSSKSGGNLRDRALDSGNRLLTMTEGTNQQRVFLSRPGSQRLLLWIAKLIIMARHVLQNLPAAASWKRRTKDSILKTLNNPYSTFENGDDEAATGSEIEDDKDDDEVDAESRAGLQSQTLKEASGSRPRFLHLYVMLTVFAYHLLNRARSETALRQTLTDLVEFEYSRRNYATAARYLTSILGPLPRASSHPIDAYLLRIYADCLRRLEKPSELAKCLISYLQCPSYEDWSHSGSSKAAMRLHQEQLSEVSRVIPPTTLQLATLLQVSEIATTITHRPGRDGFTHCVALQTLYGYSTVVIDVVKLRLASRDGTEPRFITLQSTTPTSISERPTNITLESSVVSQGWYNVDEIEVHIGNLRLLHHFQSAQELESLDNEEQNGIQANAVPILVYPQDQSLSIRARPSPVLHLAETKRLCIEIRPGHNHVTQCKVRLKTATAGLRLNIHDSRFLDQQCPSENLRTAREGETLMVVIDSLQARTCTGIEIPYTMEVLSGPSITIRIDVSYETEHGTFQLYETALVNVLLPVSVTVQDIHRPGWGYSRFLIAPSTLVPLNLFECYLEENEFYATELGHDFKEGVVVFPRQPAHWTVRLVPKRTETPTTSHKVTLVVNFQPLDDAILSTLEQEFRSKLVARDELAYAARLLTWHLLERVRAAWTEQDLEVAGLRQEMEIWREEDLNWMSVLCALDQHDRAEIQEWLSAWHAETSAIALNNTAGSRRQLRLNVEIPARPLIIGVDLKISGARLDPTTATIGQPLLVELELKVANAMDWPIEGVFELAAVAESWLIGGRRKGTVRLTQEPVRMPVVLFPQQLGHLLLPAVTIKCRRRASVGQKKDEEGWTEVPSEIFNGAHARSILVIPDLRNTTVEVFGGTPESGAGRLIATEGREGMRT